ncbi:MAG TPA: hypothetical protein VNO81_02265 [Candidatus Nitrosotenuis sp.]|jgi:hypothetical protein|nr:hypothetical protein [Candidatus Nitrosotenuis sp.]
MKTPSRPLLKKVHCTRVLTHENDPVVPRGAYVFYQALPAAQIRPGSFVLVRLQGQARVRRLVGCTSTGQGLLLHTKAERWARTESVPASEVLGVVLKARCGDRSFDPSRQSLAQRLCNRLTDYGTRSPLQKLSRWLWGSLCRKRSA